MEMFCDLFLLRGGGLPAATVPVVYEGVGTLGTRYGRYLIPYGTVVEATEYEGREISLLLLTLFRKHSLCRPRSFD